MIKIDVYLLDIENIQLKENEIHDILTDQEKAKVDSIRNSDSRLREMAALLLIRKYTASVETRYTELGKPYKNIGPKFNVSHSKDLVGIAISRREVGLDIETMREYKKDIIEYSFTKEEQKAIKTDLDFFKMWTDKEATSKCIGIGLSKGIKNIPTGRKKEYEGKVMRSIHESVFNNVICATVEGEEEPIMSVHLDYIDSLSKYLRDFTKDPNFNTTRLTIKPYNEQRRDFFISRFEREPSTYESLTNKPFNKTNLSSWPAKNLHQYMLEIKLTREIVGYFDFTDEEVSTVSFFLFEQYRHKGFMEEALSKVLQQALRGGVFETRFHSFKCLIDFNNVESMRCAESLGFKRMRSERRISEFDGETVRLEYVYILKRDYLY